MIEATDEIILNREFNSSVTLRRCNVAKSSFQVDAESYWQFSKCYFEYCDFSRRLDPATDMLTSNVFVHCTLNGEPLSKRWLITTDTRGIVTSDAGQTLARPE